MFDSMSGPTSSPPTILKSAQQVSNTLPVMTENFTPKHSCLGRLGSAPKQIASQCPLQSDFSFSKPFAYLILTGS